MKFKITFTLLFSLLSVMVWGQAEVPTTEPYLANYVSVNGAGHIWAFGNGPNGKGVYHNFNGWKYIKYDNPENVISAWSHYGSVLIVTNKGEVKRWNSNNKRWLPYRFITGAKAAIINSLDANFRMVLGKVKQADGSTKYGLYKVRITAIKNSDWVAVWTDATAQSYVDLAQDQQGNFYFVTSSGQVHKRDKNGQSTKVLNTNGMIAKKVIVGADNGIYCNSNNGTVYKLNSSSIWVSTGFKATSFGVGSKGSIYGARNGQLIGVAAGKMLTLSVPDPNKKDASGNTPLTAAILRNSSADRNTLFQEAFTVMNKKGTDVNLPNSKGDYPIHLAVKYKNGNLIQQLAQKKADLNVKDKSGHVPLYYAVKEGCGNCAAVLLQNGADSKIEELSVLATKVPDPANLFNTLSRYKVDLSPALEVFASQNNLSMFQQLIGYGTKLKDNKPFERAADNKNPEIARLCLDNGANKDEALKYAITRNEEMVMICLEKGATPSLAIPYMIAISKNDISKLQPFMSTYNISGAQIMNATIPKYVAGQTVEPINIEAVKIALQSGGQVSNAHLETAINYPNTMLLNTLLDNGGDVNHLLKLAVNSQKTKFVELAISKGATPNSDNTLLPKAIELDNTDIAITLINAGANVTQPSIITMAVRKSNHVLVKALLEKGAPVTDNNLILTAVKNKKSGIAFLLLDNGADPNVAFKEAVSTNQGDAASAMLAKGANASDPGLMASAAGHGNASLLGKLIDAGALPDNGMMAAINGGKVQAFTLLLERGANATKPEYIGAAVKANQDSMFRTLVSKGASINYVGSGQQTLLHMACKNGNSFISEDLIKAGLDVNAKDAKGDTPLHIAAESKSENLCMLLVNKGADVNAANNKGKSVLKVAKGGKVKKYLKSQGAKK